LLDDFVKFLAAAAAPVLGLATVYAAVENRLHSVAELISKLKAEGTIVEASNAPDVHSLAPMNADDFDAEAQGVLAPQVSDGPVGRRD